MPQFFEGLQSMESDSMQKILVSMMDPKNIETKTEIELPLPLAQLYTMAMVLKLEGVEELADIIIKFIDRYLVYMVSRDRQGRKEIIAALTEGLREERKLREKLTSNPEG